MPRGVRTARDHNKSGVGKSTRELQFKSEDQSYAKVVRLLGNGRVEALCDDKVSRVCKIRGNMKRKREFVHTNDIVLVGLRPDLDDSKGDVLCVYNASEVNALKRYGEYDPPKETIDTTIEDNNEDLIDFEDDDIPIDTL